MNLTNVEMTEWSCRHKADCEGYRTPTCDQSCEIAKYGKKLDSIPSIRVPASFASSAYGSTLQADPTKYPYVAPKPEELQGYIDAAITIEPLNPEAIVTYNGVEMKIEDVPLADVRAMFGYGHVAPFHNPVIERTDGKQWPYTPNMCLLADNPKGVWVDPQHLACPGCGLDVT